MSRNKRQRSRTSERCFSCNRRLKGEWIEFYIYPFCPKCADRFDLVSRKIRPDDPALGKDALISGLIRTTGAEATSEEVGAIAGLAEFARRFPRTFWRDLVGITRTSLEDGEIRMDSVMGFLHAARAVQRHGSASPVGRWAAQENGMDEETRISDIWMIQLLGSTVHLSTTLAIASRVGLMERRTQAQTDTGGSRIVEGKAKQGPRAPRDGDDGKAGHTPFMRLALEEHSFCLALIDDMIGADDSVEDLLHEIEAELWDEVSCYIDEYEEEYLERCWGEDETWEDSEE